MPSQRAGPEKEAKDEADVRKFFLYSLYKQSSMREQYFWGKKRDFSIRTQMSKVAGFAEAAALAEETQFKILRCRFPDHPNSLIIHEVGGDRYF